MSREERRNYERMMRNVERGPALPPAARSRAERNAARRAQRQRPPPTARGSFSGRYLATSAIASLAVGYGAFSIAWPNMPFAALVGVAAGLVALGLMIGFRLVQRRVAGG